MTNLEIAGENLVLHIRGWDRLLALRSSVTVQLAHITQVVVRPADARYDDMKGLRVAGGYWPGSFAAGTFWVTGGPGGAWQGALERIDEISGDLEKRLGAGHDAELGETGSESFRQAVAQLKRAAADVRRGLQAAGLPEARKHWAFYAVRDPEKAIAIDIEHEKMSRLVVEVEGESPDEAAARIVAALPGRAGAHPFRNG